MTTAASLNADPSRAWTEDFLEAVRRVRAASEIFGVIERAALSLGFERCAYGIRMPALSTDPKFILLNNYDAAWRDRYMSANYLAVDPTVQHGIRTLAPVVWSNELFRDTPQMWSEARSFGLKVGWAQSCFDESGHVGMLSLARAHGELTRAELRAHEPYLRCLANVAHVELASALREKRNDVPPVLTAREAQVIKWMALGKTSKETAEILGVTAHTIDFHLRNVIEKMQVPNRTAAVALALSLRLFS